MKNRFFKSLTLILILLAMMIPGAIAAEKELPSQEELDACFAGGFSLVEQMNITYTESELNALDRALEAMNMSRHDMNFRKDYTEGILAFPIILDMMKHPLHIAPYMDGFADSIDACFGNEMFTVPDVLACAMIHPGVDTSQLPTNDELLKRIDDVGKGVKPDWVNMNPCPPEPFHYILNAFSLAHSYAEKALSELNEEDRKLLRQSIPNVITWHDVFEDPYGKTQAEIFKEFLKDKPDEYIDELASKVNLTDMFLAYVSLPNPIQILQSLKPEDFPVDEPLFYDTPWGRMAIGTMNDDTYTGDFAILIEPGGNDTYKNVRLGSAYGKDCGRVGFFLDYEGDDVYLCSDVDINLGSSIMGVASFYDLGMGNDIYRSGHFSFGATACGIATFMDDGGSDEYTSKIYSQGAAGYGIGVMLDRATEEVDAGGSPANAEDAEVDESTIENDRYNAWMMSQGFSRQWGVGLCHGSRGNDIYYAGGVYLHAPLFNDRYQSFSQGFSIGSRGIDYAGGIAFLIDDGGNDYYLGDIYNQGVGYWYAGGFLLDKAGNDHYEMTQYGQGSGIHLAVGGLIDNSGNDSYTMNSGLGQGGSHDFAASVMMDRGGNDRYMGSTSCNGSGLTNAVGLFFDRDGNDIYGADPTANTMGGGRWARDTGSIGVFVDTGGKDYYIGKGHDNRLWTQHVFGAGIDFKPEDQEIEKTASTAQADVVSEESEIEIPEICSYEGELTGEVFDELWEISVRWEVGDNRVIVPKARERLIKFGKIVIPKIDEKFDDTYGLAARAYEVILPALYEDYPDEVYEMIIKNLNGDDESRQRNALSMISTIKLVDLDEQIVPFLDNETLRGTAMVTLGNLESHAGDEKMKTFLAPDQNERLILFAASTLLKLGVFDITDELFGLLDHEFFTVREGIIALIAKYPDQYKSDAFRRLREESINRRTRVSILRVFSTFPEFFPSRVFYNEICRNLEGDDWTVRSHSVRVLKHWLTYESEQWQNLQKDIREKLDEHRKTETDFHVLFVLDDE